jgi:hypothetical protein
MIDIRNARRRLTPSHLTSGLEARGETPGRPRHRLSVGASDQARRDETDGDHVQRADRRDATRHREALHCARDRGRARQRRRFASVDRIVALWTPGFTRLAIARTLARPPALRMPTPHTPDWTCDRSASGEPHAIVVHQSYVSVMAPSELADAYMYLPPKRRIAFPTAGA